VDALIKGTPKGCSTKMIDGHDYAYFTMIEKGVAQPHSYASAFYEPIEENQFESARTKLMSAQEACSNMELHKITPVCFTKGESREAYQALLNSITW